jgi:hypothetical protein
MAGDHSAAGTFHQARWNRWYSHWRDVSGCLRFGEAAHHGWRFVKTGPIVFMNTAEQAGLTRWRHKVGTPEKRFILEAKGPGVALLDYDNDGWLDIYFVNGSTVAALNGKEESPHAALFHNNHDGHLPMSPPRRSNK